MRRSLITALALGILTAPAVAQMPDWVGDGSGNLSNTNSGRVFVSNMVINNQPGIPFQYGLSIGLGSMDCSDIGAGVNYLKMFSKQPLEQYFQINAGMHCDPDPTKRYSFWESIQQGYAAMPFVVNPQGGGMGIGAKPAPDTLFNMWVPRGQPLKIHALQEGIVEFDMGFRANDYNFYIGTGANNLGVYGVYLPNTGNAWVSISDERLKKNAAALPIARGLGGIMQLHPRTANWKGEKSSPKTFLTLMAQDVQAVFPEAVHVGAPSDDTPEGALGVDYTALIVPLVQSTQQLVWLLGAIAILLAGWCGVLTRQVSLLRRRPA